MTGKPMRMKNYVIVFQKEKNLFGGFVTNVSLKGFNLDERGIQRKDAFLLKSQKKGDAYFELTLSKEQEKRIKGTNKIETKDINLVLELLFDSLASGMGFDEVKKTILSTKDEVQYNQIIVILLENGSKIQDILESCDFPFKEEIMQILNSEGVETEKHKKIEKILNFKKVQDSIKGLFIKQGATIGGYMVVLTGILMGLKFKLFPLIEEKLVGGFGMDGDVMMGDSLAMVNAFFLIISILIGSILVFFSLYFISREFFFKLLYKFPMLKDIMQYGNTLRLLMAFSFNYNNRIEFRKNVFNITNAFFKLEENKNLQSIGDVVMYNYQEIKKKKKIQFFDPIVTIGLEQLGLGGSEVVENVVGKKIENYIEKMIKKQEDFDGIVKGITFGIVGLMIFVVLGAVIVISFNSMGAIGQEGM